MVGAAVRAQAKVNLCLRVLAREASGYHGLETLFARLDLADDVTIRVDGRARTLECRGADIGPATENLAYRAASAYVDATGWPTGFAISIDKRIPVGGGLGGGSADAGAVLRSLNALSPAPLDPGALLDLAAMLGADVPFLTLSSPYALAWGRGDRTLALPPLPSRELWLVTFPFGIRTAEAFGWIAESRRQSAQTVSASSIEAGALRSWEGVAALAGNDFEEEVAGRYPPVAEVLRVARALDPLFAGLTGSGATVFIVPKETADPGRLTLPPGARLLRTRTAGSVEDIRLTG